MRTQWHGPRPIQFETRALELELALRQLTTDEHGPFPAPGVDRVEPSPERPDTQG